MQLKHCQGCRDNFYNGNNDLGVSQCWAFDPKKKLTTQYELSVHTPMNIKCAYLKVRKPPCYHQTGYILLREIPDYAK